MANKNKAFRPPPLPFSGNKKYWAGELYDEAALLPSGCTVWDCFGGSGVCARCIKDARPDVRVVWNDFDGYADRLKHMPETECLRRELLRAVGGEYENIRRIGLSVGSLSLNAKRFKKSCGVIVINVASMMRCAFGVGLASGLQKALMMPKILRRISMRACRTLRSTYLLVLCGSMASRLFGIPFKSCLCSMATS